MRKSVLFYSLLIIWFVLASSVSRAQDQKKVVLVSGFDDVLRQAHNTNIISAGLKLMDKDLSYAGMPELYRRILASSGTGQFYVITAMTNWLESRVDKFMKDYQYPPRSVYMRDWVTEWSITKFKMHHLEEILKVNPDSQLVVVLDNSTASVELAELLKALHPARVAEIYLRQTVEGKSSPHAKTFVTAFDIAFREFVSGRLGEDDLVAVGKSILADKTMESWIPAYAYCPKNYDPCAGFSLGARGVCEEIKTKVSEYCQKRK
ncbi:App1 family protein [Bdellovibrio bacteriovorus]|uniref:App1 family protein n=1 Tax=Bdellovibrio bacteriovorus TaxID=959 RepID=UPI0021D14429|nr:App1 family protein [Bdellovibrio bacteriovorus]UXR65456.1 App1 family protein [Bdellovibrio bacteriovorus]